MPLNEEQRFYFIEKIQRGEELTREDEYVLFPPERREYTLVYGGKESEADILSDTMAVPLQPVRTFGTSSQGDEWSNLLVFGDNLQAMKRLVAMKKDGSLRNADGTKGVRLVYIDPPFATKQEFRGSQEQKAYQDKVVGAQFLEFLRQRLIMIRELMADDGSVYVHLDQKKGHYVKVLMDEIFGEHNLRNAISRIKCNPKNFTSRSFGNFHDYIYFYAASSSTQLNRVYMERMEHQLLTDFPFFDEKTKLRYKTSPVHAKGIRKGESGQPWRGISPPPGNHWRYVQSKLDALDGAGLIEWSSTGNPREIIYAKNSAGYALQDIWDFKDPGDRLNSYPTEKSEELLKHIITASSREGDIVLDAFAGSGTSCAVAEKLGRRWVAIDVGKLAIYTIQKRMMNLKDRVGNAGRPLPAKPFTLYNAGLYDFPSLRKLPWADWRFFALQLFECRDQRHNIGGIDLDGKKRGASVLVFNYHDHPGQKIDREFFQQLHEIIGNKIGNEFYVIAPKNVFAFGPDYEDVEGTRYYALRIPYSFITELHRRTFSNLQQPNDESTVNDVVDSYGFDFIERPDVSFSTGTKTWEEQLYPEAFIRLNRFKSRARLRTSDAEEEEGQDTVAVIDSRGLSMLLLDFDYDGEVFNFDAVHFVHQLEQQDWTARFPAENLGERVMAVFVDTHGNEAQEVIPREAFGDQGQEQISEEVMDVTTVR